MKLKIFQNAMCKTVDLDDLKAKAMAADQGPHHIYTHPRDSNKHAQNTAYHAACEPQIIIALIDRLQRYEEEENADNWALEMKIGRYKKLLAENGIDDTTESGFEPPL